MTIDEHNATLESLRTSTDETERARLLVTLQQDYTGVIGERDQAFETATKATAKATEYGMLNNELWLQITNQKPNTPIGQPNPDIPTDNPTPPQKISFAELEAQIINDYKGGK